MSNDKNLPKDEVLPTEKIDITKPNLNENKYRKLTKEQLLNKLQFEVTDPEEVKLIKKVLKEK